MRLQSVRVDRYGPLSGVEHEFDGGLEVCYGPNESGKTLLLDALLRLCSPDAVDVVPEVGRVGEPPVGHAVIETTAAPERAEDAATDGGPSPAGTTEHVLGDGTTLTDVTAVTPRQLRNVFVVRDADLRLGDEHEFYDATARRLADLHTAELDALRERIVDAGRLTPTTLNLARAEDHGNAKDVRDDAAALADRIREYVGECRDAGIESAERERVEVATELERQRRALDRQRAAETLATHDRLADQLSTVRDATAALQDRECTESGLDRLEAIEAELERIDDDIADVEDRREQLREERSTRESERDDLAAERDQLEARIADLEDVEQALEGYRDGGSASPAGTPERHGAILAVVGVVGAAVAAVAGVTVAALGLTIVATIGAIWAVVSYRRSRATAGDRRSVLAAARDAGLAVETIADVAPAIRELQDERDRLGNRIDATERQIEVIERRLGDVEEDREDAIERRRTLRRERRERLRDAGLPDVAAYRDAVEEAESLERERRDAVASLTERLGAPAADTNDDSGSIEARIDYWDRELDGLRTDVQRDDVAAEEFDPEERDALAAAVDRLESRVDELDTRLDDHEAAIDGFDDELGRLPTGRFREEPIALAARSVDGLAATARDLESLVEDLERNADVSRAALAALEGVRADEEAKLADLFGPESTASATFRSITDGRYEAVTYDPDAETLVVEQADGTTLPAGALSRGTTDQLYLAARIGLADRLLHGEPGFLLLDDPLLPADPERLAAGFDALRTLAADGWQIVYFTAKPEVGEALVERHGVPCRRFDRLE
ncbi:hypothetical protein L593_10880 [Salinarchaeum sp. Harcht-Bsk1]|uniref:ATP-binding protein n=1 Tax=Salinarchaeum sp. Harcht-Bsk1 TaxID=1333523 RepID=UPI0003423991|nr:AAA family ATPase [Salinarchaeum sp. Harcht-Bsk1]AGN02121.1 hypothetical protein L593_10880 [Salinarchaeum sp. Harcht-Bsk1]